MKSFMLILYCYFIFIADLFSLSIEHKDYYEYRVEQMNKIFGPNNIKYPMEKKTMKYSSEEEKINFTKELFSYYLDEIQIKNINDIKYQIPKKLYILGITGHYLSQEFVHIKPESLTPVSAIDWRNFKNDYKKKLSISTIEKKWGKKLHAFGQEILQELLEHNSVYSLSKLSGDNLHKIIYDVINVKSK